ncbi:MAG: alcohol dehydrogenase catalytic domain-containing protein [Treponema sp.]|nr:alcohol dehydrogenase catalytic domain-containing protein [Treponema sp.]
MKMRIAKLTAVGKIELGEGPLPKIKKETDILVKVKAVGICGTDVHIFQSGRADVKLPRVMGHELSGIVTETGKGVTKLKKGDRVVLDPVFACGKCPVCKKGHKNVCADVKCFGVQMDGGFQDYIVAGEDSLYKIAKNVSFEQAALAEPFSIAANINARVGTGPGDLMVIIGSGTIGLVTLQVAKMLGAKVLISDVEDAKLEAAKKCGADKTVNSKEKDLAKAVEAFAPGGADIVLDAVGVSPLTELSFSFAAPTGRIGIIGFDAKPVSIPPVNITKKELTIVGSRMNNHRFPAVVKWFKEDKLNIDLLISRRYPVEEIQKAFEETIANVKNNIKTLILF